MESDLIFYMSPERVSSYETCPGWNFFADTENKLSQACLGFTQFVVLKDLDAKPCDVLRFHFKLKLLRNKNP